MPAFNETANLPRRRTGSPTRKAGTPLTLRCKGGLCTAVVRTGTPDGRCAIVVTPDGGTTVLERDELEAAVEERWITEGTAELARASLQRRVAEVSRGSFPAAYGGAR